MQRLEKLNLNTTKHLALRINFPEDLILSLSKHPHYKPISSKMKKDGTPRDIQEPANLLKELQRRINKRLLQTIPPGKAFYGSVKGKSPLLNAKQHISKPMLLKLDIKDFFPSITTKKVYDLFRDLGCSSKIANILSQITTYKGRLPQGTPTSSSVANLVFRKAEKRISRILAPYGVTFTIYVDDLHFSGNLNVLSFEPIIIKILKQEGFEVNKGKLGKCPYWAQQKVTGIIVNKKANIEKTNYKNLIAILHNCSLKSVRSQKRKYFQTYGTSLTKESLLGKIYYVRGINPSRGNQLLERFKQIGWE